MSDDPDSVNEILDRLGEIADQEQRVTVADMTDGFGSRSYGPFLLVPPLIEESPIGAIPGVPTALALVIMLFAVQIVIGRKRMWLPGLITNRSVTGDRLKRATDKLRGAAGFMDRWFHGRLPRLTEGAFVRIAAGVCILICLTVPPLELLPMASSVPMLAIAAFGLALLVRDGVLMIAATVLAAAGIAIGMGLWQSGG